MNTGFYSTTANTGKIINSYKNVCTNSTRESSKAVQQLAFVNNYKTTKKYTKLKSTFFGLILAFYSRGKTE